MVQSVITTDFARFMNKKERLFGSSQYPQQVLFVLQIKERLIRWFLIFINTLLIKKDWQTENPLALFCDKEKKMTCQANLYDLDGTLSDSLPRIFEANRKTCHALGRPDLAEQACGLVGLPLVTAGEILLGKGCGDTFLRAYRQVSACLPQPETEPFIGVPEMLWELHEKGKKQAVVTAKKWLGLHKSLACLHIEHAIDFFLCADDCPKYKPDPAPALLALQKLGGIDPQKAVFVGDTPFDIQCGQNAGCQTIAVSWGMPLNAILKNSKPDYIAYSVAELRTLLLTI